MPLDQQGMPALFCVHSCEDGLTNQEQQDMKKNLLCLSILFLCALNVFAQDRTDSTPASLSYKSKEIKSALYWHQNSRTGQWESRKNTTLIYLGEGVTIDNFNSLFLGEYSGRRYLFLDFKEYSWRYPALKSEWIFSRTIMAGLVSENDYDRMDNIEAGEVVVITPRFYHKMFKGHAEYSFPFFLSLGETLCSSAETMYKSNARTNGTDYAERYWQSEYPLIYFIIFKRVVSTSGRDIVRFMVYPHALPELIDDFYFEIDYSTYRNLFTCDKKTSYK